MRAVLWDLDGTLVDSAGDLACAVDGTLVAHGLPPLGEERVRGFIGEGARRLVDRSVMAAGGRPSDAFVATFLRTYAANLVVHTRVHPPELLELLGAIDAPMAVVTNKPERFSREILERLGLAPRFRVVIGGDTLPTRKPDPGMLHAALRGLGATDGVLVGDGAPDVAAAEAAGMPMIGVDWGIATPQGATVRVATVGELGRALEAFGIRLRTRT